MSAPATNDFLASAGEHDRAHARVLLRLAHHGAEFGDGLRVERVQNFGTIDGDQENGAISFYEKRFGRHKRRIILHSPTPPAAANAPIASAWRSRHSA